MLNVRDGETIVLGGLIQEEDRKTRTTIPWIGDLPFIGNLLSSFITQRVTTEVILTITPHIIQSISPPGLGTQVFWSGTDSSYATSPIFAPKGKKISMMGAGVSGSDYFSSRGTAKGGRAGKPAAASLTPLASAGSVPSIRPGESVVKVGKELSLAISDERIRSTPEGMFRFIMIHRCWNLERSLNGEVIQSDSGGRAGLRRLSDASGNGYVQNCLIGERDREAGP